MSSPDQYWLRFLPLFLRKRLAQRPELQNILANIGWLFGDKILRMGVGLVVGVWIARYLGPEQFGQLNFASSIVCLFASLATFGLPSLMVRDLVKEPDRSAETLGTGFVIQLLGGIAACMLSIASIILLRPEDQTARLLVAILGFGLVWRAADVVRYWFEAQVQSKYTVWVENCVFLVLALVKIALILQRAPLVAFVWATLAEIITVALILLLVYARRTAALRSWHPTLSRAKELLRDAWPLVLAGLAVMMYMRVDQIMIGQMLGDEQVGIYSAAVRISEVWYFIPMGIVASVFPAIIKAKQQREELYLQRLQKLYTVMVWLAIGVALPMTFLAKPLVRQLFGTAYAASAPVLAIHIWSGVFVSLGVASGKWFLAENLQSLSFLRTFYGMIVNIIFNLILIPQHGINGAALSTCFANLMAAFIFDSMNNKTRPIFLMKLKSFIPYIKD